MTNLAFDMLRQVAFPGGIFDQNYLASADDPALAITGGYSYPRVEIDDVLTAWCGVPVDIVLGLGFAKDDARRRQSLG